MLVLEFFLELIEPLMDIFDGVMFEMPEELKLSGIIIRTILCYILIIIIAFMFFVYFEFFSEDKDNLLMYIFLAVLVGAVLVFMTWNWYRFIFKRTYN